VRIALIAVLALAPLPAPGAAQDQGPKRFTRCLGADTLPEHGWYCYRAAPYAEFSAPRTVARHPDWRILDERHWNGQKYYYDGYVVNCATRTYGWLGSTAAKAMIGLPFYEHDDSRWTYSPAEAEVTWACSAGPNQARAP
jgi:hypothetical protein